MIRNVMFLDTSLLETVANMRKLFLFMKKREEMMDAFFIFYDTLLIVKLFDILNINVFVNA